MLGEKPSHLSDLFSKLLSEGHLFLGTVKTREIMNSHLRKENFYTLSNDAQENCYCHGHFQWQLPQHNPRMPFIGPCHRSELLLYTRSFFCIFLPCLIPVSPRHKMQHWCNVGWHKPIAKILVDGITPTLLPTLSVSHLTLHNTNSSLFLLCVCIWFFRVPYTVSGLMK